MVARQARCALTDPMRTRETLFRGVLPVLETPFTSHGATDHASFSNLVRHLVGVGVTGLMFPGFASEFAKLDRVERHELGEILIAETRRTDCASVLSITDHSTSLAVADAEWAADLGADALNLLPPFFLAPSRGEVIAHISAVLAAVPHTPVILQLAPALTGSAPSEAEVVALAHDYSNLLAVKVETVPPGRTVSNFGQLTPKMPCLVGYAGLFLPDALRRGATGVQPGCSFAEIYRDLWTAWTAGEEAVFEQMYRRLAPYLIQWMQHPELMVQIEKTISLQRGLIDSDVCRRPAYQLDEYEMATVRRFLADFSTELTIRNRPGE